MSHSEITIGEYAGTQHFCVAAGVADTRLNNSNILVIPVESSLQPYEASGDGGRINGNCFAAKVSRDETENPVARADVVQTH
jgi:hypothetical protein